MTEIRFKRALTHAGVFHADDVFSSALVKMIWPGIEISRIVEMPETVSSDTLVFDIGLGEFDHHQADNEVRSNGVPYASFGKLWRAFGHLLCPEKDAWEEVEKVLVIPVDMQDNGGYKNPLSQTICRMNNMQDGFDKAVEFAATALVANIEAANKASADVEEFHKAEEIGGVKILDKFLMTPKGTKLKAVIHPDIRTGGWVLKTVPGNSYLPLNWLKELPKGCTFVHQGRFMSVFETKEEAIKASMEIESLVA